MAVGDGEAAEIAERFPQLLRISECVWNGRFELRASYNGVECCDEFQIELVASEGHPDTIPRVKEVGGRTIQIARKHRLRDTKDLHRNSADGFACVCVKQDEKVQFPPGSTLCIFMDNLATPYFYGLSYFDQFGKWPWREYSHGTLGMLEWAAHDENELNSEAVHLIAQQIKGDDYARELKKQLHRLSENRHCACGRRRPFRRCHGEAWKGLVRVRRAAELLGLDMDGLLQT